MDIIPSTAPKSLTNDTNFKKYLLIVDAYLKTPNIYGMENITTAEVMDKLDMFQSRFGKIDQFGHNFCSSNIFHTIKFWYLRIGINKHQIFFEIGVICEALWCCWRYNIHKTYLKGAFGFKGSLDLAFLFIEEILHEVQKFLQWIKRLGLSFLWSLKHLSSRFYGCFTINSTKEPHKWNQFQKLFVDCWCLF